MPNRQPNRNRRFRILNYNFLGRLRLRVDLSRTVNFNRRTVDSEPWSDLITYINREIMNDCILTIGAREVCKNVQNKHKK